MGSPAPILIGVIMFIIGIIILYIGNSNDNDNKNLLNKIRDNAIIINSNKKLSKLRDDDLIFISDNYKTSNDLFDSELNISFPGQPIVKRMVKMYQLRKTKRSRSARIYSNKENHNHSGYRNIFNDRKIIDDSTSSSFIEFNSKNSLSDNKFEKIIDNKVSFIQKKEKNINVLKNKFNSKLNENHSNESNSKGSSFSLNEKNERKSSSSDSFNKNENNSNSPSSSSGSSFNSNSEVSQSSSKGSSFNAKSDTIDPYSQSSSMSSSIGSSFNVKSNPQTSSSLSSSSGSSFGKPPINNSQSSSSGSSFPVNSKFNDGNIENQQQNYVEEYVDDYLWSEYEVDVNINPRFILTARTYSTGYIIIGNNFKLTSDHIETYFSCNSKYYLSEGMINNVPNFWNNIMNYNSNPNPNFSSITAQFGQNGLVITQNSSGGNSYKYKSVQNGELMLTSNMNSYYPSIGDYDIEYYIPINNNKISILGAKSGDRIIPKNTIDGVARKNIMFVKHDITDFESFVASIESDMNGQYYILVGLSALLFIGGIILLIVGSK